MTEEWQLPRSSKIEAFTFSPISIDYAKILRLQGYRDLERIRPKIKNIAAAAARETEALIQPRVFFCNLKVRCCKDGILVLEDGTTFENPGFDRFLKSVQQVVVFILTMGHPLDQTVRTYIADDQLLNALFLEIAGWLGIEAATKQFSKYLTALASRQSLRLSPRLGPGYSYKLDGRSVIWPLEQQKTLFEIFDGQVSDVEILESCAMLPKISRSGIFGYLLNHEG